MEKWLYATGLRSARHLTLPDFLGIGAQNLSHLPQLFLPKPKELHYFDREFDQPLKTYSGKFEGHDGKIKGEFTPAYGVLPIDRIKLIRRLIPRLKLIFLMRNPIDRAWSQAIMNLVQQPGRSIEQVTDAQFFAHFEGQHSRSRGDYAAILDRWLSIFPRKQLFIGFFEQISESPRQLLSDVFDFLGVSRDVDWAQFPYAKVVHGGLDVPMKQSYHEFLRKLYRPQMEALAARFGAPAKRWLDDAKGNAG
jgi:hypothetical protein